MNLGSFQSQLMSMAYDYRPITSDTYLKPGTRVIINAGRFKHCIGYYKAWHHDGWVTVVIPNDSIFDGWSGLYDVSRNELSLAENRREVK